MTIGYTLTRALIASALIIGTLAGGSANASILFQDPLQTNLSNWSNTSSAVLSTAPDGSLGVTFDGYNQMTTNDTFTSSTGEFTLTFDLITSCGHLTSCGILVQPLTNVGSFIASDTGIFRGQLTFPDSTVGEKVAIMFTASTTQIELGLWYRGFGISDTVFVSNLVLTDDPTGIPYGVVVSAEPVPEPASIALCSLGVGALSLARRRRASAADPICRAR
jgi:hypothetical protein